MDSQYSTYMYLHICESYLIALIFYFDYLKFKTCEWHNWADKMDCCVFKMLL